MDNVREKLVELLESINAYAEENLGFDKASGGELIDFHGAEYIADHLLANNVTVQEWIPVTERLPIDAMPVLVYYGFWHAENGGTALRYTGTLSYFCFDPQPHWQHESTGLKVTHWMPLPTPPKGVSEEALPVADEATERSVAVEKTEESASPKVLSGTANWR